MYKFTGVQSGYYWSGTSYASNPYIAGYVGMDDGYVGYSYETSYGYVWPVRSDN